MLFLIYVFILSSLCQFSYGYEPGRRCQQVTIPVNITAHPRNISLSPPANQSELTGMIANLTSMNSNFTKDVVQGERTLTATYNIWTLLCLPLGSEPSLVEFAIHGITLDHTYWDFEGEGSPYSYCDAALNAGHAIFIYDRLGTGNSSIADPLQDVQEDTEIEIASELINYIRTGRTGHSFQEIIGIGHSYGSTLLAGIASKYGNLLNATILTGFTPYSAALSTAIASFGLSIAADESPGRFGSLNHAYLTITNEQAAFLYFPFFDPGVLNLASETKQTAALGQLLSLNVTPATDYTNPVFVVTGDRDFIYCGGDCYQSFAGSDNLVLSTISLFPNVSLFSYAVPVNMGHVINFHYAAPQIYKIIQLWISQLNPKIPGGGG